MRKGFLGGILFVILGAGMFWLSVNIIIPAAKNNSQNCTLKVEAVVIGNETYSDEDAGGYWRTFYNQIIEYEVEGKRYEKIWQGKESEPVVEGSIIEVWVDPADPFVITSTREWESAAIACKVFSSVFLGMGILGCIFSLKRRVN